MKLDLATARRVFAMAPHIAELGIVPVEVADGRICTELEVGPKHLQHSGVVHAGVIGSMADHTMGAAAQTLAADGLLAITAELKLSMLRSAPARCTLRCEANVIKPGRSLSFTEAEVYAIDAAGERTLVIKASATMALMPMPAQVRLPS